jgi:replicative DNA helicase
MPPLPEFVPPPLARSSVPSAAQPAPAAEPPFVAEAHFPPPAGSTPVEPDTYRPFEWHHVADGVRIEPRNAVDVLASLSDKVSRGALAEYQPIPLGFTPLDKSLGGGMRTGELLLIGGAQGTGKTTFALQMARNIAMGGQAAVLYICFEHDDEYLLNRLISLESVIDQMPQPTSGMRLTDVRKEVLATSLAQGNADMADLVTNPLLRGSLERIARYGPNLYLMRGTQTTTTVDNLRQLVQAHRALAPERQLVVMVDYLQKVPVIPDPISETERVTTVVNSLKDLALSQGVAVVSIVAADKEGLKASRLRSHHLRGSSAINYEADVIMILNEKYSIVAKVNIEFNPYQAQRFRDWIVLTVEKNRSGQHSVDIELKKHFEYACFDPTGRTVQEKLIEERLYND